MKPTLEEGNRLLCVDEYKAENKEIKFDVENHKLQVDFGDGTGYHDAGGGDTPSPTPTDELEVPEWDRTKSYKEGDIFRAATAYINGKPRTDPMVYYQVRADLDPISDKDWETDFVERSWQNLADYYGDYYIEGMGNFRKIDQLVTSSNLPQPGPYNIVRWQIQELGTVARRKGYMFGSRNEDGPAVGGYMTQYNAPAVDNQVEPAVVAPHPYLDLLNGRLYVDGGLGNSLARVSLSLASSKWEANSDSATSTAYPYKATVSQSLGNKFRENFASGEISIIPSLTVAQSAAGDVAFVEANSITYNESDDKATLQFTVYSKNSSAPSSDIDFKAVIIVDHDFNESVFDDIKG